MSRASARDSRMRVRNDLGLRATQSSTMSDGVTLDIIADAARGYKSIRVAGATPWRGYFVTMMSPEKVVTST
jgi:hypothetical protein